MNTEMQLDDKAPWKRRFRTPFIAWTQTAPANPQRGLVVSNTSGKYQLHTWEVQTGAVRQLTDHPTGLMAGAISGDGQYVYYMDDKQGNEIGHIVRVPFEGGEAQDITPDLPPYSSWAFSSSGTGNKFGFVTADANGFHIYSLAIPAEGEIGEACLLFHSKKLAFGPMYSYDGAVAIISTTERATMQHYDIRAYDTTSGAQIAELWEGPDNSLEPIGFPRLHGDLRLACTTNRSGTKRPFIWNIGTGERTDLNLDELAGEIFPLDWSNDGQDLLLCQFDRAVQQLYLYNLASQTVTKLNHPSGTYGFYAGYGVYFGLEGEIFAQWQDAAHPPQLIALDARTGEKKRTILAAGEVPPGHAWKSVAFPSSDGQMIQGWLGLPDGKGPFPTILHTHGGPEAVTTEVFGPNSQAWMDHGFAFLTINYRGSISFGREFQEKIWGNVGYWEMEDLAAAHAWLLREGIAQPDAILLTGSSYGGYMTLMGLGKLPDLWAGGMGLVVVADWTMMYEDSAETLKGYQVALFGGTPEEKPEQYRASSPITYAENVKAPVLIIQGRNDSRTPARPAEAYVEKLKSLGKPVEIHWFEAGHIGAGIEQDIQNLETMLRFAYRVLG